MADKVIPHCDYHFGARESDTNTVASFQESDAVIAVASDQAQNDNVVFFSLEPVDC